MPTVGVNSLSVNTIRALCMEVIQRDAGDRWAVEGMHTFGVSAPPMQLQMSFGFTAAIVADVARNTLGVLGGAS